MNKKELAKDLGLTLKQFQQIAEITQQREPRVIPGYDTENEFTFAVVSDTHLCSIEEKRRELKTFYRLVAKRGIRDVLHCGDIVAGMRIYRGQEFELHTHGFDNQAAYTIKNYPRENGVTTHFITGN